MTADAEIAVIVHAYARKEYLPFALRSIAAQTLARDRFELVVSKSFWDPEIDRQLDALGAVSIHDEDRLNSRCLHRGLGASRAPIITFLDDDDEYEPERLERVLETMRAHPGVGFYRNRVRAIDENGQPIPPERWRVHMRDSVFDALGPLEIAPDGKAKLLELAKAKNRIWASFNSSSMAIRRELLDGDVGNAFDEAGLNADLFLFVAGVLASGGMYLDDRRLTRYRYSPRARYRMFSGNAVKSVASLGDVAEVYHAMAALAARHGRLDFAKWLDADSVYWERLFRGCTLLDRVTEGAEGSEVARLSKEFVRFLLRKAPSKALRPDVWRAGAYALAYLCAPRVAQHLAKARFGSGGIV